jgi:hypothetical protein
MDCAVPVRTQKRSPEYQTTRSEWTFAQARRTTGRFELSRSTSTETGSVRPGPTSVESERSFAQLPDGELAVALVPMTADAGPAVVPPPDRAIPAGMQTATTAAVITDVPNHRLRLKLVNVEIRFPSPIPHPLALRA